MSGQDTTCHPSASGPHIPIGYPIAIPIGAVREPPCRPCVAAQGPNRDGTPPVSNGVIRVPVVGRPLTAQVGDNQ